MRKQKTKTLREVLKEISKPAKPLPLKKRVEGLEREMSMLCYELQELLERVAELEKGDH